MTRTEYRKSDRARRRQREAHLRTYVLVVDEPRCAYCSGTGHTLETHERREGKKVVREPHQRTCSVCNGTGKRTSAPPRLRKAPSNVNPATNPATPSDP